MKVDIAEAAFPLAVISLVLVVKLVMHYFKKFMLDTGYEGPTCAAQPSLREVRELRQQHFAPPNRHSAHIRRRAGNAAPRVVSPASLAASSAAVIAASAAVAAVRAWRRARASISCAIAAQAPSQRAMSEVSCSSHVTRMERALGAVDRLSAGGLQKDSRLHHLAISYLEGALTQPERSISAQNSKWATVWANPDVRELLDVVGFEFHAASNTVKLQTLTEQRKKVVRAALGRLKCMKGQDFWFD